MTSTFQNCIVSYIDLNNLGNLLSRNSANGVRIMRALHQLVNDRAHTLTSHEEVCFWQDSVLLLAPVNASRTSYEQVMSDVKALKESICTLHPCHAVSVKGQSFRAPNDRSSGNRPRVIYLAASSFALSNCFEIESRLNKHKADWYIDSRIINKIKTRKADAIKQVKLLPKNASRKIHIYHCSFA